MAMTEKTLKFDEALSLVERGYGVGPKGPYSGFEIEGRDTCGSSRWLTCDKYCRDDDGSCYCITVTWGKDDDPMLCVVNDWDYGD